ncbi:MAG TPA: hypothetical protein VGL94_10525 [Ktedonobacteraceae bacterium]
MDTIWEGKPVTNRPRSTDALKRVPTLSGAEALPAQPTKKALAPENVGTR